MSGFAPKIKAVHEHDYLTLSFVYSEGNTLGTFANHNVLRDTAAIQSSSEVAICYIFPEMHATFERAVGLTGRIIFFAIDVEKRFRSNDLQDLVSLPGTSFRKSSRRIQKHPVLTAEC